MNADKRCLFNIQGFFSFHVVMYSWDQILWYGVVNVQVIVKRTRRDMTCQRAIAHRDRPTPNGVCHPRYRLPYHLLSRLRLVSDPPCHLVLANVGLHPAAEYCGLWDESCCATQAVMKLTTNWQSRVRLDGGSLMMALGTPPSEMLPYCLSIRTIPSK